MATHLHRVNSESHEADPLGHTNLLLAPPPRPRMAAATPPDTSADAPRTLRGNNQHGHPDDVVRLARHVAEADTVVSKRARLARMGQELGRRAMKIRSRLFRQPSHDSRRVFGVGSTAYDNALTNWEADLPGAELTIDEASFELHALEMAVARAKLERLQDRRKGNVLQRREQQFFDWFRRQGGEPLLMRTGVELDDRARPYLQHIAHMRLNPDFFRPGNFLSMVKKSAAMAPVTLATSVATGAALALLPVPATLLSIPAGAVAAGVWTGRRLIRSTTAFYVNKASRAEDAIQQQVGWNMDRYQTHLNDLSGQTISRDALHKLIAQTNNRNVYANLRQAAGMILLSAAIGALAAPVAELVRHGIGQGIAIGSAKAHQGLFGIPGGYQPEAANPFNQTTTSQANLSPYGHIPSARGGAPPTTGSPAVVDVAPQPGPSPSQIAEYAQAMQGSNASQARDFVQWADVAQKQIAAQWAESHHGATIPAHELEIRMNEKLQALGNLASTASQTDTTDTIVASPGLSFEVPAGSGKGIISLAEQLSPGHKPEHYTQAVTKTTKQFGPSMFQGVQTYALPGGQLGLYPTAHGAWTPEAARYLMDELAHQTTTP